MYVNEIKTLNPRGSLNKQGAGSANANEGLLGICRGVTSARELHLLLFVLWPGREHYPEEEAKSTKEEKEASSKPLDNTAWQCSRLRCKRTCFYRESVRGGFCKYRFIQTFRHLRSKCSRRRRPQLKRAFVLLLESRLCGGGFVFCLRLLLTVNPCRKTSAHLLLSIPGTSGRKYLKSRGSRLN